MLFLLLYLCYCTVTAVHYRALTVAEAVAVVVRQHSGVEVLTAHWWRMHVAMLLLLVVAVARQQMKLDEDEME